MMKAMFIRFTARRALSALKKANTRLTDLWMAMKDSPSTSIREAADLASSLDVDETREAVLELIELIDKEIPS